MDNIGGIMITRNDIEKRKNSERGKRYEKFLDICDILYDSINEEKEYYSTCKDIFKAVEEKHLDILNIISNDEYEDFKVKALKDDFFCPCIGNPPEPKYDISTSEGYLAFCKDHRNEHWTV